MDEREWIDDAMTNGIECIVILREAYRAMLGGGGRCMKTVEIERDMVANSCNSKSVCHVTQMSTSLALLVLCLIRLKDRDVSISLCQTSGPVLTANLVDGRILERQGEAVRRNSHLGIIVPLK